MKNYDVIIRGGTVVDGSGGEAIQADVAILGDRIALVAPHIDATASREMDASKHIVTPGFVDVHTHYDGQATWDSHLTPSSCLGATTVVMGNCGVGFAPCRAQDHGVLIALMEGVEDIPGTALAEGLKWNWDSFPSYLDALEAIPRDIDIAALFPHAPLRVNVMAQRAVNREPASETDLAAMQDLLRAGLKAGAVGLSTSRTFIHRTNTGDFTPTYQAACSELKQLGDVLDGSEGHVFQLISDFTEADDEFEILRHVCRNTGAKATFTLLQSDLEPQLWREQLQRVEQAQAQGLDIQAQVLSRPLGVIMGLSASMTIFSARPTFKSFAHLPLAEKVATLSQPEIKAQILAEQDDQPHIFIAMINERKPDMYPFELPLDYMPPQNASFIVKAQAASVSLESYFYDWMLREGGKSLIYIPAANFTPHIADLLTHAHTLPALGDGGAHVGTICDASAGMYVLTHWVQSHQAISLEAAIHKLTRKPAELYSLHDRGLLQAGMKADINIIDLPRLQLQVPHIVHDLPANGKRFLQSVDGLVATFVSGQEIYSNGRLTGALPGKLVRGAQEKQL